MENIKSIDDYLSLLGHQVCDRVTGFKGVVSSVSFDLYGCVQCVVTPECDGGTLPDGKWFDENRLSKIPGDRVMEPPLFVKAITDPVVRGPQEKPIIRAITLKPVLEPKE